MTPTMRGDRTSGGVASRRGNSTRKNRRPCRGNAPLQEEGTYLIDDAGALADQAFAHPMESLHKTSNAYLVKLQCVPLPLLVYLFLRYEPSRHLRDPIANYLTATCYS
jgi:hypothetical protein